MEQNNISLTKLDQAILGSYRSMVYDLGAYLGASYEIILHSLEDLEHSAIAVVNGWHSGRQEGAPITDLALRMLDSLNGMDRDPDRRQPLIYTNRSKSGTLLKSTTIPVFGANERIIGLLCVNLYLDTPLETLLKELLPGVGAGTELPHSTEVFANDSSELISEIVMKVCAEVMAEGSIPSGLKNKEIIRRLQERGIFRIKDSVAKVAELLHISKNTVYLHLRGNK